MDSGSKTFFFFLVKDEIQSKIKPSYAFHLHSLVLSARSQFCKGILERRDDAHGLLNRSGIKYRYSYNVYASKHVFELEYVNVDVFQEFGKYIFCCFTFKFFC